MIRRSAVPAAIVLAAACTDPPLTTEPTDEPAAALVTTAACTKSWADASGGAWEDAANWFPVGVPTAGDHACIEAPGAYEVTMDTTTEVASLVVGGRGLVTLRIDDPTTPQDGARLTVSGTLQVVTGSTLVFEGDDTSLDIGGALINDGTIRVVEECGCALATTFDFDGPGTTLFHNRGLLDFGGDAVIWIHGGTFINEGDITSDFLGPSIFMMAKSNPLRGVGVELRSGTIAGRHALEIFANGAYPTGSGERTFAWTGGTIERTVFDSTVSALQIGGFEISLASDSLAGTLDVLGHDVNDTTRIGGVVPAGVQVRLLEYVGHHTFAFDGATNRGAVHVGDYWPSNGTLDLSFERFTNEGLFTVSQLDSVAFTGDSIVNAGTMLLATRVTVPSRLTVLRNEGVLRTLARPLRMGDLTTFHAAAGSVMTGRLLLEGATLEGDGEVGTVVAVDGTIRPGAPIGTLTAENVALDARSALFIDIAGADPGTYDQLAVRGEVVYGGATLAVSEVAPFVSAQCGQVVPIVTDSATVPRGGFGKLVGLAPAFTRSWRIHNPANVLELAGYNPIVPITVQPDSVTAVEGGAEGSYAICLGNAQPTADVVVNTARRGTQVEALPVSRTFDATNWMLPQFVRVIARNDADVEGPHSEIVDHTVTSADPYYASAFLRWVDVGIVDNDQAVTSRIGPRTAH